MARRVAVAVAGRAGGAGLADAPGGGEALARQPGPDERIAAVFLDPPFIRGMAADVMSRFAAGIAALGPRELLRPDALLIIRADDPVPEQLPALRFMEKRAAGNAWIYLYAPDEP